MTAKEFFKEWLDNDDKYDGTSYTDCMIEFAKYHVEQALLKASEEAYVEVLYYNDYEVNKKSILKAYPLKNIK